MGIQHRPVVRGLHGLHLFQKSCYPMVATVYRNLMHHSGPMLKTGEETVAGFAVSEKLIVGEWS